MSTRRYAVLHHTGVDRPHFDLLFEMEPNALALTTLRCPRWPLELGDALEELPEHRRLYLEYEGEISGDRGRVRRVEAGDIDVAELAIDPPTLGLRLHGARERVAITLVHRFGGAAETSWIVAMLNL